VGGGGKDVKKNGSSVAGSTRIAGSEEKKRVSDVAGIGWRRELKDTLRRAALFRGEGRTPPSGEKKKGGPGKNIGGSSDQGERGPALNKKGAILRRAVTILDGKGGEGRQEERRGL